MVFPAALQARNPSSVPVRAPIAVPAAVPKIGMKEPTAAPVAAPELSPAYALPAPATGNSSQLFSGPVPDYEFRRVALRASRYKFLHETS